MICSYASSQGQMVTKCFEYSQSGVLEQSRSYVSGVRNRRSWPLALCSAVADRDSRPMGDDKT